MGEGGDGGGEGGGWGEEALGLLEEGGEGDWEGEGEAKEEDCRVEFG